MQNTVEQVQTRRFDRPDDRLDFAGYGGIDILKLSSGAAAMHAVFKPGWRWEEHEKPLLGNPTSCPMRHVGYCIAGKLRVRLAESGDETTINAGDFFDIPPGHDGYVIGDRECEVILFAPPEAA
jgi:quercetin dioxygenase-like cupin family protein